MKINSDDIKQMAKTSCCPTCRQTVSGALQQHIASAAGEALPTAESYRRGSGIDAIELPGGRRVDLREDAQPEARERALNRTAAAMGVRTKEGRRVFLEGRRGFDPAYNSNNPEAA
jgi:hypothetical protein